jgi:hypothetical protein
MALRPNENRFRSTPIGPELPRSDKPASQPENHPDLDPVQLLCEELCGLKGKRVQIASITEDAIPYVKALYPEAEPYGNLGHWTWIIGDQRRGEIVAEAWPAVGENKAHPENTQTGWWLRIKRR